MTRTSALIRRLDRAGGPAGIGVDRLPHLAAAIVSGQRGPRRGGIVSLLDLELGFPTASYLMTIGWLFRPLLAPLVQSTPPVRARSGAALLTAIAAGTAVLLWESTRRAPRRR